MPARRNTTVTGDSDDSDSLYTSPATSRRVATSTSTNSATIPTSGTGSDKENRFQDPEDDEEGDGEEQNEADDGRGPSKKDKGKGRATQALHERVIEEEGDKKFYDPEQRPEERRIVRKGLRELGRSLNGMS